MYLLGQDKFPEPFNFLKMKIINLLSFGLLVNFGLFAQPSKVFTPGGSNSLRAPAYPLVTIDPNISTWSLNDRLYDDSPKHWTKTQRTLIGGIRVDGMVYRFMGIEEIPNVPVVYTGELENWDGRYIEEQPITGWEKPSFNDSQWKEGKAPYSSRVVTHGTRWRTKDIWVRRVFNLPQDIISSDLMLKYSYDDYVDIFINGILVVETEDAGKSNQVIPLSDEVKKSLKVGKNVIAAHGHNEDGLAFLDFGIVRKTAGKINFSQNAIQKSVMVLPTQTWYTFDCGPVSLELIFTSPYLPEDLYLYSRPVNYITWQVKSNDSRNHSVQVYLETTPEWAVNRITQPIKSEMFTENDITFLKTGTIEQPVLEKKGDDMRIDWGYYYLASKADKAITMAIGDPTVLKRDFLRKGRLTGTIDKTLPEEMFLKMTAMSMTNDLGKVGSSPVSGYAMLGYDDVYSIQYFNENLLAYWRKGGTVDIRQAISMAASEYESLMQRCSDFNKTLLANAEKAGGLKYAELCALVYRQSAAAHKLVITKGGEMLFLSKENTSNGCISTVDATYPSAPMYLVYNPNLIKGMLNGIFYYSESGIWTKEFAPHDLGYYPIANGQVNRDDGSERLMPVEESGNMLILTTVISMMESNGKYAEKHWKILSQWADYLLENGLDPANQLCTDDFAGHLAHNANLSIKAIMGIAGYGKMAEILGKGDIAAKYISKAREMATEWIKMAKEDSHYKLAFDQPGTWSQKYNLVWDKIFRLNIFPPDIAKTEIDYYLTKQNEYGLPLDSRKTYTKNDWVMWTATLAEDQDTFNKIVDPIWKYSNETQTRMPVSDWHETTDGKSVGMFARSVVGGYFMKMLEQKITNSTIRK